MSTARLSPSSSGRGVPGAVLDHRELGEVVRRTAVPSIARMGGATLSLTGVAAGRDDPRQRFLVQLLHCKDDAIRLGDLDV